MSEHRYDIRISGSCVDPNPLRVERQDPDNFPRLQTRKRCALEIAAYVFKIATGIRNIGRFAFQYCYEAAKNQMDFTDLNTMYVQKYLWNYSKICLCFDNNKI